MFELKIASNDATSGTIPISWCVSHETIKLLGDDNVKEPQVVIVVAPDGDKYSPQKEYRKVVPLQDLMTYIEFRSSGANKIWGFISLRDKKDVRDRYLTRENGEYQTDVLNSDGTEWSYAFKPEHAPRNLLLNSPVLDVKVPKECFASEPSKWEKVWVNHFFRDKCLDQCKFRRRRLFAYGLQPLIMLGNLLVRFVCLLAAVAIVARKISFKPLIHPLNYDIPEAASVTTGGSFCVQQLPEDKKDHWEAETVGQTYSYLFRSYWSVPGMPVIAIPLILLAVHHCWIALIALGAGVTLALIIVGIVSAIMTGTIGRSSSWLRKFLQGKLHKNVEGEEGEDSENWFSDRDELEALICTPDRKAASLASLPAKKKTMRLRFLDLKSKVCRPFSV